MDTFYLPFMWGCIAFDWNSWSESWSILKGQSWFNFWRRDISLAKQSCCFAHGLSIALCSSGRLWIFNQFCKLTTNCQMTTALISGVWFSFSVCKPAVSLGLDRQLLTQELKNHPPTRHGNLVMSTCLEETWRLRNKRYGSEYSYDWRGCIKKTHKEWYMMQYRLPSKSNVSHFFTTFFFYKTFTCFVSGSWTQRLGPSASRTCPAMNARHWSSHGLNTCI